MQKVVRFVRRAIADSGTRSPAGSSRLSRRAFGRMAAGWSILVTALLLSLQVSVVGQGRLAGIGANVPAAQAQVPEFRQFADFLTWPMKADQEWIICRGYNYSTHTGTDQFAFDLVRYDPNGTYNTGCPGDSSQVATTGEDVLAAASGTVASTTGNGICVDIDNVAKSFKVLHVSPSVAAGQW